MPALASPGIISMILIVTLLSQACPQGTPGWYVRRRSRGLRTKDNLPSWFCFQALRAGWLRSPCGPPRPAAASRIDELQAECQGRDIKGRCFHNGFGMHRVISSHVAERLTTIWQVTAVRQITLKVEGGLYYKMAP